MNNNILYSTILFLMLFSPILFSKEKNNPTESSNNNKSNQTIQEAIKNLGNENYDKREDATRTLKKNVEKNWKLIKTEYDNEENPEIKIRLKEILYTPLQTILKKSIESNLKIIDKTEKALKKLKVQEKKCLS